MEIQELDEDTMSSIRNCAAEGLRLLGLDESAPAAEVVRKINEYASGVAAGNQQPPSEDDTVALGALLGEQYVRGLGWHWGNVVLGPERDNASFLGVLSADDALFVQALWWMNVTLHHGRQVSFMLNYNMVASGNGPPAKPGEAVGFH